MPFYTGRLYTQQGVSIATPDVNRIRCMSISPDVAASVGAWLTRASERDDVYYFTIASCGIPIGQIILHDIDWAAGTSLVAYHLFDPSNRSQGFGTAALRLLMQFVRERTNLIRLTVITSRDNKASQRIAEKCGFSYKGTPQEDPMEGVVYQWERPASA